MTTPTQRARDRALLAAGHETGWWDEHGHPAPWPGDIFDPDNDWRPDTNPPPELAPGEQPF